MPSRLSRSKAMTPRGRETTEVEQSNSKQATPPMKQDEDSPIQDSDTNTEEEEHTDTDRWQQNNESTAPPLPAELPPTQAEDDGWAPIWDENAKAYYFYNRFTGSSQWTNPRVPEAQPGPPGVGNYDRMPRKAPGTEDPPPRRPYGGYDPTIHGDYDPTAPYAQEAPVVEETPLEATDPEAIYTTTGVFNRFTGKWQAASLTPENFNDENKSKRQMSAFFDVDAAANSHNGKSLKAERSGKKLSKQELKAFKEKRRDKKEERRRAWLRD